MESKCPKCGAELAISWSGNPRFGTGPGKSFTCGYEIWDNGSTGYGKDNAEICLRNQLATANARIAELEAKLAAYREALENIADPIGAITREAKREGNEVNWPAAKVYSNSAECLSREAQAALNASFAGADLLERLKKAEEFNQDMRSVLEWIKKNLLEDVANGSLTEFGESQSVELVTIINDALGIKPVSTVVPEEASINPVRGQRERIH